MTIAKVTSTRCPNCKGRLLDSDHGPFCPDCRRLAADVIGQGRGRTGAQSAAAAGAVRHGGNKFNARKTVVAGLTVDSKAESERYVYLTQLEAAGEIQDLELQPAFECVVNGQKVCTYRSDFRYRRGEVVTVEDVKSGPTKTPVYRLKKKLVLACLGVAITEVAN